VTTVSAPTDTTRKFQPGDRVTVTTDIRRTLADATDGERGTVHGYARSGHVEVRLSDGQLHQLAEDEIEPEPTPEQRRRAEFIADLRRMADFLAANTDIPLDTYPSLDVSYHPRGTDEQELAEVERVAAMLGVEAAPESEGSSHVVAVKEFGSVRYKAIHIPAQVMADWDDLMRIGRERKAALLAPADEQAGA
jgi:hypothetical protein